MTELKPYKKEKEGKLQRLPVRHITLDTIDLEQWAAIIYHYKPDKQTRAIIRGSVVEVPLDPTCGVKRARMVTNPFIALMRRTVKAIEEREKANG